MRRECDIESIGDFSRYYLEGWVGINTASGVVVPVLYRGGHDPMIFNKITRLEKAGKILYAADKADEYQMNWEQAKETLQFSRPDVGMIKDNIGQLLFSAVEAARNTKRGLRLNALVFTDFNRWHLRSKLGMPGMDPPWSLRYDLVWGYFNPAFASPPDAWRRLQAGQSAGEALSRNFGLYTVPSRTVPLLAYKQWTIGYMPSPSQINLGWFFRDYEVDLRKLFAVEVRIDG